MFLYNPYSNKWFFPLMLIKTWSSTLIFDNETNENGGFVKNVILRYFVPSLINSVTFSVFYIVDILFIFGEERKCVHDKIAKTKVIKK